MEITLRTDGSSNMGAKISSHAWIICDSNGEFKAGGSKFFIGEKSHTSNQEEYLGILSGIKKVISEFDLKEDDSVFIETDSELVVKQLEGTYRVKNNGLKPLNAEIKKLIKSSPAKFYFRHIVREHNELADWLAKQALSAAKKVESCLKDL